MATNKRPLKAYVRYDGSGRAVSSSLIWRKNKPKVGNWKEVQGYECCNPGGGNPLSNIILCKPLTFPPTSSEIGIQLNAISGGFEFQGFAFNTGTTLEDLIVLFNTNFSFLGQFTLSPSNEICLQLSSTGAVGYGVFINPSPSDWVFNIIVP